MYEHERSFAAGLADRAATIGMSIFRHDVVRVTLKADLTPVTQADTQIEAMVRGQIASAFPDDRVLGEEEGGDASGDGRVWIVDPIDATANFARGIPIWATLIALQVDGEQVLGLVNAPALGERYEAVAGGGATCNGDSIRVSDESALARVPAAVRRARRVERGTARRARTRDVVRGPPDARVRRLLGPHAGGPRERRGDDRGRAVAVGLRGAGADRARRRAGRMTAIDGGPLRHGGSVLTTNGVMHDELVRRLSGA